MFLYLLHNIISKLSSLHFLNVFRYLTFRTIGAFLTAFLIGFFFAPKFIKWSKIKQKKGQPIRADGPQTHLKKTGTPTMGGIIILVSMTISTLLWANLANNFIWVVIMITLGFGALGAFDDYSKIKKNSSNGMTAKLKFFWQISLSIVATYLVSRYTPESIRYSISLPFIKDLRIDLGFLFFLWSTFVIVGSSNAVNLTDGLDGLVIVPVMLSSFCFSIICYLAGNKIFANYLHIDYVPGSGEIAIFLASCVGASLSFLWFNAPPAKIFMGDTGSLALGGALGTISIISKHEIVWAIIGGIFIIETISVIVQVFWFKKTGNRMFLMAPIHHHFEKKGWEEPTVVVRFWIISAILAIIGLSTLKLR